MNATNSSTPRQRDLSRPQGKGFWADRGIRLTNPPVMKLGSVGPGDQGAPMTRALALADKLKLNMASLMDLLLAGTGRSIARERADFRTPPDSPQGRARLLGREVGLVLSQCRPGLETTDEVGGAG